MTQLLRGAVAVGLAYAVCAVSGVNRWMFIWLKGFYPSYALVAWVILLLLLVVFGGILQRRAKAWLLIGLVFGYVAGAVAYQLAPAIRDGSFTRSVSTVKADGLIAYIQTSALYPLLCLSPVLGVLAVSAFLAFVRPTKNARYLVGGLAGAILVIGWSFFLSRGGRPPMW